MDALLELADYLVLDKAYAYALPAESASSNSSATAYSAYPNYAASSLERDNILRQSISILAIAGLGAAAIYFIFSGFSYTFVFDKRLEHHPRFLKDQIRLEIQTSLAAIPFIDILTLPLFLAEVRGYSLLYTNIDDYGYVWLGISTLLYMVFNDIAIYWIHRLEHDPSVYKWLHKPHHKWIIPTPWAALAFHPVDGWLQSLPYHIFVFICPMQKHLYLVLFVLVQLWTVFIHDSDMITNSWLEHWLNSPAHHTMHHMYFTCNYGQYFTWADKYYDSHRAPSYELDPIHESLKVMKTKGLVDEKGNPVSKKTQ